MRKITMEVSKTEAAVLLERSRQQEVFGFRPHADDGYAQEELVRGAIAFASVGTVYEGPEVDWPFPEWPLPERAATPEDETTVRMRNLTKAAALLLAELQRLERVKADEAQNRRDKRRSRALDDEDGEEDER